MTSPAKVLGFRTKKEALTRVRAIVATAPSFRPLVNADADLAMALLALHPDRAAKVGPGVSHVYVAPAPRYARHRCLWVKRSDGSRTDFSFHEALSPSSGHAKRLRAARQLVDCQVDEWRASRTDRRCATCGAGGALHVDHANRPFVRIYEAWERHVGREPELAPITDASADERFACESDAASWQRFHSAEARFQLLCPRCNMAKGCR